MRLDRLKRGNDFIHCNVVELMGDRREDLERETDAELISMGKTGQKTVVIAAATA